MGKSAPAAPDYTGAAKEQATASADITNQQTWANRPTLNTPWGSQTWDTAATTDPATGKPVTQWSSDITLTPDQQQALDSQQNIQQGRSNAAETLLGQATGNFQTPADWNSLPQGSGSVAPSLSGLDPSVKNMTAPQSAGAFSFNAGDPNAVRQQAQDAVWNLQKPMLDQQRSDMENRMANQGLGTDTEAYKRSDTAMNDAYGRAQLQAVQAGQSEANQMFNQGLQNSQLNNQAVQGQYAQDLSGQTFENQSQQQQFGNQMNLAGQQLSQDISAGSFNNQNRQQAIAEMLQKRGTTLNELNALLSGQQVSMPQMQNFSQATKSDTPDLLNATNMGYQANMDAFNAKQAQTGQILQGVGTAAMMFSDLRLKEDVRTVGALPSGLRIVDFAYKGFPTRFIGVIAQEAALKNPDWVKLHPSGYLMVDYSKVN